MISILSQSNYNKLSTFWGSKIDFKIKNASIKLLLSKNIEKIQPIFDERLSIFCLQTIDFLSRTIDFLSQTIDILSQADPRNPHQTGVFEGSKIREVLKVLKVFKTRVCAGVFVLTKPPHICYIGKSH